METLSRFGHDKVSEIASRHGFSAVAVREMLDAVRAGHGSMAQFSHPEFGGAGQWMRGGMTMVSDMFNHRLAARVDSLAAELAAALSSHDASSLFKVDPDSERNWWPPELGTPDSTGRQNAMAYAYFGGKHRLAINEGGKIRVYDTLGQKITGVSQQQSTGGTMMFSTASGVIDLSTLPLL